ncbi:hypothetical protein AKJ09_06177 [Labilithrix luteola]|uniref:DUF4239 domain-containing protein n=1 Tax=Labilithrix luteola TaxID=1391654 RepID=A0A0K1Q152_9BACT|nr:hypothetical protein [Labilithrix luteola]AKU99513.1 hypothetical protein AKJ09_06177 [Labilithrix luteola]
MDLFIRLDAWLSAFIFAGLMIVGWFAGSLARTPRLAESTPSTRIEDASLALFGLLLAFCFSGAASRYEARKELLRDDAIAIGELATVGSALEEPDRHELTREIRSYVEQRLTFGPMRLDDPKMAQVIREGQDAQARIWTVVKHVIANKNTPTIHAPLVNAYNGVTAAHDKRLHGVRNQVSGSIVLMLVLFGVFTTFTMGRLHDRHEEKATSRLRIGAYVSLVALVFAVTIDLEQPRRGLLLVSQAPMAELLTSLKDASP